MLTELKVTDYIFFLVYHSVSLLNNIIKILLIQSISFKIFMR
jgi:hypothetical protein